MDAQKLGSLVFCWGILASQIFAVDIPVVDVEGQPVAANVERLIEAYQYLGRPLPQELVAKLRIAGQDRDAGRIQELLDPMVLFAVSMNPEVRVKVQRGPAPALLQQAGFTPVLIKVLNDSTVTKQLNISSPQDGAVYSGAALSILQRQAQTELNENENTQRRTDRFLQVEMFQSPPMTPSLSGLEVEYALALIYCVEAGKREATIGFDVGQGTQDIGFRGEVPVLFDVRPAIPLTLRILDDSGLPTMANLTIQDQLGHIYPPMAKRLAPDFFFQPQIYRADGETVLLPPGQFQVTATRGPEYLAKTIPVNIEEGRENVLDVHLQRWIRPMDYGFYCGDHHIHGAGCSHYDNPTQGVTPRDMFRQVKGEGLNVGCVLTWGPCFDFQRQYFSPAADEVSEPMTLLKYDIEVSGFGSAALGHICLLNLKDQTYPGSNGTKTAGWPTWTVPALRWCKEQGGVTGYPHSAMHVNPKMAAKRLLTGYDRNRDRFLSPQEAGPALLPKPFETLDADGNRYLSENELQNAIDQAADELPNLAVPEMDGGGALEICVSAAEGVCDFISAMDTARIPEWNTWYHLMNCGMPMKLSGETDFPCMSSRRVGQGRVYVQLGEIGRLDFTEWCTALGKGRSYVSDGFAHALQFEVNGTRPGFEDVSLPTAGQVIVRAKVAFAEEIPKAVAYGTLVPGAGNRMVGDTVNLHAPRSNETIQPGTRLVELIRNGEIVASQEVPADGEIHALTFEVNVPKSSWLALRHFPQLHTNPVNVIIGDQPIRASADSARWCAETIRLLWQNRSRNIAAHERAEAKQTYDRAIRLYQQIERECGGE
ncbi:MAG: CehA/McbA family metallohydrolase [Planctomycetaceae bacterium]|nr:CehA/McbA family metallohydrolase [Planctomycetaceae bacterium]